MKKILIITIAVFGLCFTACDPQVITWDEGKAITADQLNISAWALEVDGSKSNKIILENHSPVNSYWDYSQGTSRKALDTVLVSSLGEIPIKFIGLNPDGTTIEKSLAVTVERIAFKVEGMEIFTGGSSKTWVWDQFNEQGAFGIGGMMDLSPSWWSPPTYSESDYYMVLSETAGPVIEKFDAEGNSVEKGTFSFNLKAPIADTKVIGMFEASGATIPHPYSQNGDTDTKGYKFYIMVAEDNQLILASLQSNLVPSSLEANYNGETNFWLFRPSDYEPSSEYSFLCGEDEKTWVWADGAVYGKGGYLDVIVPAWWGVPAEDIGGQDPVYGSDGYMTFKKDRTLIKSTADGSTQEVGKVKLDMNKTTMNAAGKALWGLGKFNTTDVTVLNGKFPSDTNGGADVFEYDILEINDDIFTLATPAPDAGAYGECLFWRFKAKEEE